MTLLLNISTHTQIPSYRRGPPPSAGYDNTDDSVLHEKELSAARRQFDELDATHTGTLNEEEIADMVKQLRPMGMGCLRGRKTEDPRTRPTSAT